VTSYVYTCIGANYIPKARVLLQTLRNHDPRSRTIVVVVDRISPTLTATLSKVFDEIILAETLGIPDFSRWIFGHTLVEACTAMKGFVLAALLDRDDASDVMYLDPDIALFDTMEPIRQLTQDADICLTPHLLDPETERIWIERNEITALKHGTFNLGFLLVKASDEGRRFAKWWRDRLQWYCRADIPGGLFTDQRWADLVPSFFPTASIVRDSGCNVATWNIAHRPLAGDFENGFKVGEQPLRFFHFSGIDSGAQKQMLDISAPDMPAAHAIREWYIAKCMRQDMGESALEWSFARFDNGEPITLRHRTIYRESSALQDKYPNPFRTDENDNLWRWFVHNP
jgi:hypothetical protein